MKKNKHLTPELRNDIHYYLSINSKLEDIAKFIGKHKTTISKEVKKHRVEYRTTNSYMKKSTCSHHRTCTLTKICNNPSCNSDFCRNCNICTTVCSSFELDICDRLKKFPFVCDGCIKKSTCKNHIKYFYKPDVAQSEYKRQLSSSRQGINLTEDELKKIDDIVSPLIIENSQSIDHILATHTEISVSRSTLYSYIESGVMTCSNIDLPKKVRYKKRRKKNKIEKTNTTELRNNRTYEDYLEYMKQHPDAHVIEMDTLEGVKGEPLLLTLHDVSSHFQIAHLMKNKESKNIRPIFELYKERINNDELFTKYFQVILTDNGAEFSDTLFLENMGIKLFFCDPGKSYQKGSCERNHEFMRKFIPKGTSFKHLHQRDIWLMMSHINSYKRESLNYKSPYEVVEFIWGKAFLKALHIAHIEPDEVKLNNRIF